MIRTWMTRTGFRGLKLDRPLVTNVGEAPDTALHSSKTDLAGLQRLVSDRIQMVKAYSLRGSRFRRPDRYFTGYAADGYWYSEGELDPSVPRFEASWALESAGPDRGDSASFPERFLVVVTASEVCLINAGTYAVWMRFRVGGSTGIGTALGPCGWNQTTDIAFMDGYLVLAQHLAVLVIDFTFDAVFHLTAATSGLWPFISGRNSESFRGVYERSEGLLAPGASQGRALSGADRSLPSATCYRVEGLRSTANYETENYEPTFLLSMSHGFAVLRMRARSDADPRILMALPQPEELPFRLARGTPVTGSGALDFSAKTLDPGDEAAPEDLRSLVSVGDRLNYAEIWSWPVTGVTRTHLRVDAELTGTWGDAENYYFQVPIWVTSGPGRSLFGATPRGYFLTADSAWVEDPASALPVELSRWPGEAVLSVKDVIFDPYDEAYLVSAEDGVYGVRPEAYQATLLYGPVGSDAEYPILPAGSAGAMTVDAAARTLAVCLTEGRMTKVVEVDTRQRRILKTTVVPGRVRRLGTTPREV